MRPNTNGNVMEENAVPERFCLGCGVSMACLKSYDKRLLCGEASGKIFSPYKIGLDAPG